LGLVWGGGDHFWGKSRKNEQKKVDDWSERHKKKHNSGVPLFSRDWGAPRKKGKGFECRRVNGGLESRPPKMVRLTW